MINVLIAENQEKLKDIVGSLLSRPGNISIEITRRQDMIRIRQKDSIPDLGALKNTVLELEDSLYNEQKGVLYRAVIEQVEKPLLERALLRCEGNQLKAARLLGINRNTMRSKIKKLHIDTQLYKP